MTRHERFLEALSKQDSVTLKCFGQSMMPIIKSGSTLTFAKSEKYEVGDIVYCRIGGRVIQAHRIKAKRADGKYLIANNRGHENGWTHFVYAKVTRINGVPT